MYFEVGLYQNFTIMTIHGDGDKRQGSKQYQNHNNTEYNQQFHSATRITETNLGLCQLYQEMTAEHMQKCFALGHGCNVFKYL